MEELMAVKEVIGLVDEFEAACEDEQLAQVLAERIKESRLGIILRELTGRINYYDEKIIGLEKEIDKLAKISGQPVYSGPHPLQAVRIPSDKEIKKIIALSSANTVTTSKLPPLLSGKPPVKLPSLMRPVSPDKIIKVAKK